MKKSFVISTILILTIVITACNGESEEANNNEPNENSTPAENESTKSNSSITTEDSETSEEISDNEKTTDNETSEQTIEDQLNLAIGDTGTFDTTLGTYDITLNSAKIIEEELDGEASQLDNLILLDITVRNTSDRSLQVEDLLANLEVTHDLEGTGSSNAADYFDSVDEIAGEIAPEEEVNGQFIADISKEEKYFFRKKVGNIAAETSNQVIWTIPAEEAKE
ncbi:hypothetical protein BN988_00257 [Oceanobacillus picturae]|uniref:DUF4352 domain-containing protein n=1 Tax=Oceanobacillus picturae TaxID=171693 RepID=W9AGI9_9BACI|nr:hypothetical protein [Oceanobacillus picturae]RIU93607.1 DUF4352 domain-containing protein [Oceanobacillus picturae]CDO01811.1 hypothetical protein BN988_00257 [Oceanobacillus picturae]